MSSTTNPTNKEIKDKYYNEGYQHVDKNHLNKSYKYQDWMGEALLAGSGIGLSWYAIKRLVDRAYKKRLHQTILNDTTVPDTYEQRVTPVENEFVGMDEPTYKSAGVFSSPGKSEDTVSEKQLSRAVKGKIRGFQRDPNTTHYILDPSQSVRTRAAVEMAKNPAIAHSLAFASIPALFALSTWGAGEVSKKLFNKFTDDTVEPLTVEKAKAKQDYEAAARMLRSISSGELEKTGALKKQAVFPFLVPLAWAAGGTAAGIGGKMMYDKMKSGTPAIREDSPELSGNSAVNGLLNLGLGLGAIAMLYPGYKFVQSLRKGYNDRAKSVSDAQVAMKAWNAQRQASGEDFATLRAALAAEPDLLQKYFNPDGTLKKNLQIT